MPRIFPCLALLLVAASLSACCPCGQLRPGPVTVVNAPAASIPHIGPKAGDVLRVTVAGEKDLSGDYTVGPDGAITMPLAGKVAVAGQPNNALAGVISDAYRAGYLVNPKVSVEVKSR